MWSKCISKILLPKKNQRETKQCWSLLLWDSRRFSHGDRTQKGHCLRMHGQKDRKPAWMRAQLCSGISEMLTIVHSIFLKIFYILLQSPIHRRSSVWLNPHMSTTAGAELIWRQEPGASSGSATRVQEPKALGHPWLLSQTTGRGLDGKRGCRD